MGYTMLTYLLQFLVISTIFLQATASSSKLFCLTTKWEVRVINNILPSPAPITLHCASGNVEKGYHTLTTGQEFKFEFCIQLKTLFFCHLWWNGKNVAFEVYNQKWNRNYCKGQSCYWEARSDGIYHSTDSSSKDATKSYDWS
ncbi:hypothetical protein PHJA_001853000 [Phtheirospermum japonicum]|uniref:S-protein homolog n=1 Tax=Phtheirospermum japonicum TaxID=374723 RepID=A0A830CDC8_9LAMI|nr:hypothetical protein PHJA_001853000 [Phtheirospermum japonicum]